MSDESPFETPLAELLGTNSLAEQTAKVQALLEQANTPVFNVLITIDPRRARNDGLITIAPLGGIALSFQQAYAILEEARQELLRQEREAATNQPKGKRK